MCEAASTSTNQEVIFLSSSYVARNLLGKYHSDGTEAMTKKHAQLSTLRELPLIYNVEATSLYATSNNVKCSWEGQTNPNSTSGFNKYHFRTPR